MLARVVTFDGVTSDRMNEMKQEMESGQPPEGTAAAHAGRVSSRSCRGRQAERPALAAHRHGGA